MSSLYRYIVWHFILSISSIFFIPYIYIYIYIYISCTLLILIDLVCSPNITVFLFFSTNSYMQNLQAKLDDNMADLMPKRTFYIQKLNVYRFYIRQLYSRNLIGSGKLEANLGLCTGHAGLISFVLFHFVVLFFCLILVMLL